MSASSHDSGTLGAAVTSAEMAFTEWLAERVNDPTGVGDLAKGRSQRSGLALLPIESGEQAG